MDGQTDRRGSGGRTDGRMDGWMDRQTDIMARLLWCVYTGVLVFAFRNVVSNILYIFP